MAQAAQKTDDGPDVHWRSMHESSGDDFTAADLMNILEQEKATELHVRIEAATGGSVEDADTRKSKKRVSIKFQGIDKPYKSNVTNNNAASKVVGKPFPRRWVGHVVTLYVSKATRPKRKGDPEDAPNMVTVDAIRFRSAKPGDGVKVYGDSRSSDGAAFDLDGWLSSFASPTLTREEFTDLRTKLNATKRPASSRDALAKAVEAARVRLYEGAPQ